MEMKNSFGARLLKTEMEIEYFPEQSKKTDYSVLINNKHIGVSVTRAMKFKGDFTEEDARVLLYKKLYGIIVSSENGLFFYLILFYYLILIIVIIFYLNEM